MGRSARQQGAGARGTVRPDGALTRRCFLLGAAGIAALGLAACGGTNPTATPAPSIPPSSAAGAAPAPSATPPAGASTATARAAGPAAPATRVTLPAPRGFPATIAHQFGSTRVRQAPQRAVSVGYTDQDYLLALEVVPVAILRWFATQPRAVGPWAEPLLGGAQPQIIPPADLDFEAILKLSPDLITGIQRTMNEEEYARLATIAPTLSQPSGFVPFGVPWREQARVIALAVGQREAMERIIADLEAKFAAAKGANPQFAGKTFAAILTGPDGQYYAWTKQDGRVRFFEALGLTLSPKIDTGTATTFYNTYSRERISELEADVMLAFGLTPEALQGIKGDVLLQALNVAKAGRIIYMEDQNVSQALSMNTVLSLPYAIDGVTPALARVVR